MTLDVRPNSSATEGDSALLWGEVCPREEKSEFVRFALGNRVVTFRMREFSRWEHVSGEPETLMISTGSEMIAIVGRELSVVRAALEAGRLVEVRLTHRIARPGPRIHRIVFSFEREKVETHD